MKQLLWLLFIGLSVLVDGQTLGYVTTKSVVTGEMLSSSTSEDFASSVSPSVETTTLSPLPSTLASSATKSSVKRVRRQGGGLLFAAIMRPRPNRISIPTTSTITITTEADSSVTTGTYNAAEAKGTRGDISIGSDSSVTTYNAAKAKGTRGDISLWSDSTVTTYSAAKAKETGGDISIGFDSTMTTYNAAKAKGTRGDIFVEADSTVATYNAAETKRTRGDISIRSDSSVTTYDAAKAKRTRGDIFLESDSTMTTYNKAAKAKGTRGYIFMKSDSDMIGERVTMQVILNARNTTIISDTTSTMFPISTAPTKVITATSLNVTVAPTVTCSATSMTDERPYNSSSTKQVLLILLSLATVVLIFFGATFVIRKYKDTIMDIDGWHWPWKRTVDNSPEYETVVRNKRSSDASAPIYTDLKMIQRPTSSNIDIYANVQPTAATVDIDIHDVYVNSRDV